MHHAVLRETRCVNFYENSYLDAFHARLHIGVKPEALDSDLSLVGKCAAPHIPKAAPYDRCGRSLSQVQIKGTIRASMVKQVAKHVLNGLGRMPVD